jgi:hypothetical protein
VGANVDHSVPARAARAAQCLGFLAWITVTSCGVSVAPTDPFFGTWRSDEFDSSYPSPPSRARAVHEWTFDASGRAQLVITRRYAHVEGSPYSGCTWIQRHPELRWFRDFDAALVNLVIAAPPDARYTSERSGCADASQNRPQMSFPDSFPGLSPLQWSYRVRGDLMELTMWGPIGVPPDVRAYTRVR